MCYNAHTFDLCTCLSQQNEFLIPWFHHLCSGTHSSDLLCTFVRKICQLLLLYSYCYRHSTYIHLEDGQSPSLWTIDWSKILITIFYIRQRGRSKLFIFKLFQQFSVCTWECAVYWQGTGLGFHLIFDTSVCQGPAAPFVLCYIKYTLMKLIIFTASRRLKIFFDKISGDLQARVVKRNIFFFVRNFNIGTSWSTDVLRHWHCSAIH